MSTWSPAITPSVAASPPRMPPFGRGGDERQIAGAWNGQKQHNGGDKGAVVSNAKHDFSPVRWRAQQKECAPNELTSLRDPCGGNVQQGGGTPPSTAKARIQTGCIQTMQRSASSPGTANCST